MFATVKAEAGSRLIKIESFFQATCNQSMRACARTAKGLAFVQMYSVYEYTVTNSVRAAILEIKGRSMALKTVRWELLGLVLDPELTSVSDCGREKVWQKRINLMQRVNSQDPVNIAEDTFPDNGTQFRRPQLETIWQIFGISSTIAPPGPCYGLIPEMVEHRNAVAHGRSSAEEIGRRYSKDDILKKIGQCNQLCTHVIGELENHCSSPANLQR